jgi:hypothetical protein
MPVRDLWILVLVGACDDGTFDLDAGNLAPAGAAYIAARGCGNCHDGEQGRLAGRATPLPGTRAYPANLTPDRETGLGGWADVEIIRAIRFGFDHRNQPLCPPMSHTREPDSGNPATITAYDDVDDGEARAIVAYLRSLSPVARPDIPESECPPLKPPALDLGASD